MLPGPAGLLKFMLCLICAINIEGRELYSGDYIKSTFRIGLYSDACEPVAFNIGMMLDTTDCYIWIPF